MTLLCLYILKKAKIWSDVTIAGRRTNKRQTRKDRATQPIDHGRLRWAISLDYVAATLSFKKVFVLNLTIALLAKIVPPQSCRRSNAYQWLSLPLSLLLSFGNLTFGVLWTTGHHSILRLTKCKWGEKILNLKDFPPHLHSVSSVIYVLQLWALQLTKCKWGGKIINLKDFPPHLHSVSSDKTAQGD